MSEMVERVAKTLFAGNWQFEQGWDDLPPNDGGTKRYYRRLARETISAMREPTEAMISAAIVSDAIEKPQRGEIGVLTFTPATAWQAMIDEALKEKGPDVSAEAPKL